MLYGVEEARTKIRKTRILVIIIIVLLVLMLAIFLGMKVAETFQKNKLSKQIKTEQVEETKKNSAQKIENTTNSNENDKALTIKQIESIEKIYNSDGEKRAFLTFDDGPSESVTPHILDILKKENIKATFFVLGNRVSYNSDLIKRQYNEGHYIANHGYSHKSSKIYSNTNMVLEEYNKTDEEIRKALGNNKYSSKVFRFPGGSVGGEYDKIKEDATKLLKDNGIAYLDWNALTNDAAGAETKEEIMENLKETVEGKSSVVILMHDAPDKEITYKTLPEIIQYLKKEGYTFKNIYDIL